MASIITYVDVANTKSVYDGDDIIVVQDKIESTESVDAKYAAMKKTKLSPMRLFMQSGMAVDLSFTNNILTLTLKDASGNTIATKTVEIIGGVSDVEVDGASVVVDGVAKVEGKYSKPSTGIPKSDLSSEVQSFLDEVGIIDGKIPTEASSSNKLADKAFVNSSIATETAHYISNNGEPFTSVEQLRSYTGTVTNNDYAFVTGQDEAGNTYYDRYKATVSGSTITWAKEYRLNNSSFTAAQWAAISSGITSALVASYNSHIVDADIHVTASKKSDWDGKYNKPASGIPKSDLSSEVQSSLAKADTAIQEHQDISGKQDLLVSGTNIKTINYQSILGSGNINISGGGGIVLKGEKTGAELAALTVDDVEPGWTYRCTSAYGSFEANVLYSAIVDGTSLSWMKVAVIDLSAYVQKTRKVNGYTLENDVTLNLTDLPDYEVLTQAEALTILNA